MVLSDINGQRAHLLPSTTEGLQPYKHLLPGIATALKNGVSQQGC